MMIANAALQCALPLPTTAGSDIRYDLCANVECIFFSVKYCEHMQSRSFCIWAYPLQCQPSILLYCVLWSPQFPFLQHTSTCACLHTHMSNFWWTPRSKCFVTYEFSNLSRFVLMFLSLTGVHVHVIHQETTTACFSLWQSTRTREVCQVEFFYTELSRS